MGGWAFPHSVWGTGQPGAFHPGPWSSWLTSARRSTRHPNPPVVPRPKAAGPGALGPLAPWREGGPGQAWGWSRQMAQ